MQTQILLHTPPPSWYHYVVKRIMSVDFRVLDTLPSPKAPVQKAQEAYNPDWELSVGLLADRCHRAFAGTQWGAQCACFPSMQQVMHVRLQAVWTMGTRTSAWCVDYWAVAHVLGAVDSVCSLCTLLIRL